MLELIAAALGTSSKMDFLPLGAVRTDPLLNPTCLSDHVHTFYGAAASLRPETTYDDMRAATLSSGNARCRSHAKRARLTPFLYSLVARKAARLTPAPRNSYAKVL